MLAWSSRFLEPLLTKLGLPAAKRAKESRNSERTKERKQTADGEFLPFLPEIDLFSCLSVIFYRESCNSFSPSDVYRFRKPSGKHGGNTACYYFGCDGYGKRKEGKNHDSSGFRRLYGKTSQVWPLPVVSKPVLSRIIHVGWVKVAQAFGGSSQTDEPLRSAVSRSGS